MPEKSAPFSMRLSRAMDRRITAEAQRTKRSKGAVVGALAEEGLKARLVPGIAFREDDHNRRAWLIGTAFDVWQVIEAYQDFGEDDERMLEASELTERQLRTALTYYRLFPEEIDARIARNRRSIDELRDEYPFAKFTYVDDD